LWAPGLSASFLSQVVRLKGAGEVTQVDRNKARRDLARKNGAAYTHESLDDIQKDSFDLVVDATGVPALMARAPDFTRKGGTVLWFGVPPRNGTLELPAFTLFEKGAVPMHFVHVGTQFPTGRDAS